MKPLIITVTALLSSWVLFIACDYIDETIAYKGFALWAALILPVAVPVLYLVFQKKIHDHLLPVWENYVIVICIWIMGNLAVSTVVVSQQDRNRWFIPQAYGSWDYLLNGIEYGVFVVFILIVPLVLVIIWKLILYIYKRMISGNT